MVGTLAKDAWTPGMIDPVKVLSMYIAPLPEGCSEAVFLDTVVDWAKRWGWMVNHPRPAMVRAGKFITPQQGHVGYPDLTLVHEGRKIAVFAELKQGRNKLSPEQVAWREAMLAAGLDHRIWRPDQWVPEIAPLIAGVTTA